MSEEAHLIRKRLEETLEDQDIPSVTLAQRISESFERLDEAFYAAQEENWDGWGGLPVSVNTYCEAGRFLQMLPSLVPAPEIDAEPDGEISFEWYLGPRQAFSVSVGEDGRMSYAGLFGSRKSHGTEFLTDEIPTEIFHHLQRLYSS